MKRLALAMLAVLIQLPAFPPLSALAGTTGSLTGTIVSTHNADPIANARVTATSGTQIETTRSDLHGNFAFVSLAPDVYKVAVEHDGYRPTTVAEVPIFADASNRITFTLVPELVFILPHVDRTFSSPVRPGTIGDIYPYNVATISLFPPVFSDLWALRMTPGITLGAGAAVAF